MECQQGLERCSCEKKHVGQGISSGVWSNTCGNVQNPVDIPLYWLVNRDSYNASLQSPYNWVGFHPLYTANNQGQLVTAHLKKKKLVKLDHFSRDRRWKYKKTFETTT